MAPREGPPTKFFVFLCGSVMDLEVVKGTEIGRPQFSGKLHEDCQNRIWSFRETVTSNKLLYSDHA